jgi:NTP pyrophosphatase (non-canonical NTP hydrolase)
MSLTFNDYQDAAATTAVHPGSDDGYANVPAIVYLALGLGGEAGEVQEKVKKVLRDKNGVFSPEDIAALGKEIGDVLWYAARLSDVLGLHFDDVAQGNLDKLGARRLANLLHGSGDDRELV